MTHIEIPTSLLRCIFELWPIKKYHIDNADISLLIRCSVHSTLDLIYNNQETFKYPNNKNSSASLNSPCRNKDQTETNPVLEQYFTL